MLKMKKLNILALFFGMLLFGGLISPNSISAQITGLSTLNVCPGDSILVFGDGFATTDSMTVDGVHAYFTCDVDRDSSCFGSGDTMLIIIPFGPAYGVTATLQRYENGAQGSFTLNVCQGLVPDTVCHGDTARIFFDFSPPNTIDSIEIDNIVFYDQTTGIPAFPNVQSGDSVAVMVIDPSLAEGGVVNVDVKRGPTSGTNLTYPMFIKYLNGAYFDYGQTHICSDSTGVFPSVIPQAPGTFVSTPSGIIVNAATGEIDPNLATPPYNYFIQFIADEAYSCTPSHSVNLYVAPIADAGFTYPDSILCSNDTLRTPTIDFSGGVFNAVGLSPTFLNATTGEIPTNAPIGLYMIYYTQGAGTQCEKQDSFQMRIGETPTVSFSYNTACFGSGVDPVPILGGGFTFGGTFSDVSTLLTIDDVNGIIDIDSVPTSAPYTIEYTIDTNSCFASHSTVITIDPPGNSNILYNLPEYCVDSNATADPSLGTLGGTFSFIPAIPGDTIVFDSLGRIDLTPGVTDTGTFSIIYRVDPPTVTCPNSDTTVISIVEAPDPSFSYASSVYCQLDPDPLPGSVSAAGGFFDELTNNVQIDSSNGSIDLSASIAGGPYVVQYTVTAGTCIETGFFNITVVDSFDAGFFYSQGTSICRTNTNPVPTVTGDGGGVFSGNSTNISVNDSTGMIYLDSSVAGPHMVYYSVGIGACAGLDSFPIIIEEPPTVDIEYPNNIACTDSGNPLPTVVTGPTGGTFSEPLGYVNFNGSNGRINVNTSTVGGPYIIYYETPGTCTSIALDTVTIMVPAPAGFMFTDTAYCPSDNDPVPVVTGLGGGTWSASDSISWVIPGGVDIGRVDLSQSADDSTHFIYYTSPGPCPSLDSATIKILPGGVAGFRYPGSNYCTSDTVNPFPQLDDPGSGGTFTALDPGIVVVDSTGEVKIDSTIPGVFTIRYTVGGGSFGCEDVAFASIEIGLADTSAITYDTLSMLPPHFCENAVDPFPELIGAPGGIYQSADTNNPVIFVNDATGQVDVSVTGASPDPFTVTYRIGNNCAGLDATAQFYIDPVDTADFYYENVFGDTVTSFCNSEMNPLAVISSSSGGVFVKAADSVNVDLDSLTGMINLLGSQTGTYNIFHRTLDTLTGCRDTAQVQIDINPDPAVSLRTNLKDSVICDGSVVKLTALGGNPRVDCYNFEIKFSGDSTWTPYQLNCGELTGNILDTTGIPLGLNELRITLENSFGCTTAESLFVQVNPIPQGQLLRLDSVISGREQVLAIVESGSDNTKFAWNLKGIGDVRPEFESGFTGILQAGDTAEIRTTRVVTTNDRNPSEIRVSVYPTSGGCVGEVVTDTLRIIPNGQDFFIPEVITPNGNGQNDYWVIQWNQKIHPSEYYIQVFNRMGGMVYELERLDNFWYGGGLPDGIYWWILRKRSDNEAVQKGGLKILREGTN